MSPSNASLSVCPYPTAKGFLAGSVPLIFKAWAKTEYLAEVVQLHIQHPVFLVISFSLLLPFVN